MQYTVDYSEDHLEHHGILGQKWGVRRFQNEDGSLTPAGIKRYGSSEHFQSVIDKNVKKREMNAAFNKYYNRSNNIAANLTKSQRIKTQELHKKYDDAFKEYTKAVDLEKAESLKVLVSKTTPKEKNDYRNDMINRYKNNPKKQEYYKNATDEQIAQDIQHMQNVKKGLIAATAVAGISIGVYVAYKHGVFDNIAKSYNKSIGTDSEAIKRAMEASKKDLGYVLDKNSVIHRMVGYDDFDMDKVNGPLYTSFTKGDRYAYASLLKDWNKTGKRYDVSFSATKDINVASKKAVEEVFNDLWDNDPTYKDELFSTLSSAYAKLIQGGSVLTPGGLAEKQGKQRATYALQDDKFKSAIYSIVKGDKDSQKLIDSLKKKGYDAIEDYFDKGDLGEAPLIILDPKSSLKVSGQSFVSETTKALYSAKLATMVSHPARRYII